MTCSILTLPLNLATVCPKVSYLTSLHISSVNEGNLYVLWRLKFSNEPFVICIKHINTHKSMFLISIIILDRDLSKYQFLSFKLTSYWLQISLGFFELRHHIMVILESPCQKPQMRMLVILGHSFLLSCPSLWNSHLYNTAISLYLHSVENSHYCFLICTFLSAKFSKTANKLLI